MKATLFVLAVLTFGYTSALAQKVSYEKTFEDAQAKSKEKNKPLFLFIGMHPPSGVQNFMAGFHTPEVISVFKESFISFRTDREDQVTSLPLIKKYNITTYPAFVFFDSNGGVLFKDFGNSSLPDKYLTMAKRAIGASKEKPISGYDNEYASGKRDTSFLKDYISKRRAAGITNNGSMIEEYVNQLSVSDLEDYNEVLFILEAGPTADSKAYRLAYTNRRIIDSIYKTEPLSKRTLINNTIISNSMAEAIALKSEIKLTGVVNFVRGTWGTDYHQGQKNSTLKYLQYYKAVSDTSNYLMRARPYYDQYYMYISADSIKRMDKNNMEKAKQAAMKEAREKSPGDSVRSFSFKYSKNTFSTELNNGAYSIYETGTKNSQHLTAAMLWSKRSIELDPQAAFYDTLAHLLYRLGFPSEALAMQEKAVELAKFNKQPYKSLQDELLKIKNGTL